MNKVEKRGHVSRLETGGVQGSPEVRSKLPGIHTSIDKEKRLCVLGAPRETRGYMADRESALWRRIFEDSLGTGDKDRATKMADSALRFRARTMTLAANRPKTLVTTKVPTPAETVVVQKGRVTLNASVRCKAQTLGGKQCGFKSSCGDFCKKHAPT